MGADSLVSIESETADRLARAGFAVSFSSDMRAWKQALVADNRFVSPHFDPDFTAPAGAAWIRITDKHTGALAACLAYRIYPAADYLEMVENGRIYVDDPAAWGFRPHRHGLDHIGLAGRVMSRGGLHSFAPGHALSFWICGIALEVALQERVDLAAGITLPGPHVPLSWYGYRHSAHTTVHEWPNFPGQPHSIEIVWSHTAEIREEVARRRRLIAGMPKAKLGEIAREYERCRVSPYN
ncbi:hypothetical protein [Nisaea sediminum]|uniref:hypothetical protein n=2 Tax=Pseudomonadota TaxID=1224 RepID=UPI001868747F|nr:hypothetical protein [Nisaea sediminum]